MPAPVALGGVHARATLGVCDWAVQCAHMPKGARLACTEDARHAFLSPLNRVGHSRACRLESHWLMPAHYRLTKDTQRDPIDSHDLKAALYPAAKLFSLPDSLNVGLLPYFSTNRASPSSSQRHCTQLWHTLLVSVQ